MLEISLGDFFRDTLAIAAGATLGLQHFQRITSRITEAALLGESLVAVDMAGIEDATPSYIKATILALHQSGRLHANVLSLAESQEVSGLKPLNVVSVLLNTAGPVQDCVHEVFSRRGLAIFAGTKITGERLTDGVLLGRIDPAVVETLEMACSFEEFQAADLHTRSPRILVTGWNNRLAELHRQRLVRRRTEGRTHRFIPLTSNFNVYGQVLSS